MALPAGSFRGRTTRTSMLDRRTEAERWALIVVPVGALLGFMIWSGQRKRSGGFRGLGHGGHGPGVHCAQCGPGCGCAPCMRRWG